MWWLSLVHAVLRIQPTVKVPVVFSSTDMNRLSIRNGRIKQIFGADLFQIEKDEEAGQIFLHVKDDVVLPESMSMSFVTDDNVTQDLLVTFEEGTSTSVIFEFPKPPVSLLDEAKKFFYAVITEDIDRYVRQVEGQSLSWDWGDAYFKHRVMGPYFTADVYDLKGKKPSCYYHLKHSMFLGPGVKGVYISNYTLHGKNPAVLIILRQRQ